MDYCSSCRRHLNGALVCPGCGAYAPDIAPSGAGTGTSPAAATAPMMPSATMSGTAAWGFTHADAPYGGRPPVHEAVAVGTEDAPAGSVAGYEGAPSAPQGRAARRRQLARWKKKQRRAVVATAVALVGGGLTVATTDRGSPDRTHAAAAPEHTDVSAVEEQAPAHARPSSQQPDTYRSSRTSPATARATGLPDRQPPAAVPRATPPSVRQDAATAPRTTPTSAPRPQSTSSDGTAPDRTDTAADTQQTPAPEATNGTDDTPATQPSPAPTATSPGQICLLVVCIG
jgi:hypothetical protein